MDTDIYKNVKIKKNRSKEKNIAVKANEWKTKWMFDKNELNQLNIIDPKRDKSPRCRQMISYLTCRLLLYYFLHVFHAIVSCWAFIGIWVSANLPRSPGLFSAFWSITVWIVSIHPPISGSSRPFPSLWGPLLEYLCSRSSLVLWQDPSLFLFFRFVYLLQCDPLGRKSPH